MKKKKNLIILYFLLIIFELYGFIICFNELGCKLFIYYTELSNVLLLISSIFELYKLIHNEKEQNKLLDLLNYSSVLGVCITFLVVIFLLAPQDNFNYSLYLFNGSMLFHHLLCPLLGFVLFLISDKKFNKKDIFYSLIFTLLYSFIVLFLNIFKVLDGPYFFFMIYKYTIYRNIFVLLFLLLFIYFISFILYKLKK